LADTEESELRTVRELEQVKLDLHRPDGENMVRYLYILNQGL